MVEELPPVTPTAPASREAGAARLLEVLAAADHAGVVRLIGSMAEPGKADVLSDIDLRWTVPSGRAAEHLASLRRTLQQVARVESLRVDPAERPDMLLVFVRFRAWPLWWRVDLEIHATGAESMQIPDADPWSPPESACMGIVVTLKALARNRPEAAERLWVGTLERVGASDTDGGWPLRIGSLLDHLETSGPQTADLVSRTRRLSRDVLGE